MLREGGHVAPGKDIVCPDVLTSDLPCSATGTGIALRTTFVPVRGYYRDDQQ